MTKKFFKTYFGIPDKQNRVDVGFERGYRNIVVRFNGNDVALFTFGRGFQILMLFALLLPVLFKSAAVGSFYRNGAKFKQYVHMSSLTKQKTNPDLVDI